MAGIDDPITWAMDSTGDIEITNDIRFATGLEAVVQKICEAIATCKGEYFLDLDLGIDQFGEILGQKFNQDTILNIYREAILGVENVQRLLILTADFNNATRVLTVTFQALTAFGVTDVLTAEEII